MIRISWHAYISSKNVARKKTLASLYVVDCGLNTSLDVRLLWMMRSINDTSDSIISKFVSSITDNEDLLADLYTTKQLPMMRRRSHMELPAWRPMEQIFKQCSRSSVPQILEQADAAILWQKWAEIQFSEKLWRDEADNSSD